MQVSSLESVITTLNTFLSSDILPKDHWKEEYKTILQNAIEHAEREAKNNEPNDKVCVVLEGLDGTYILYRMISEWRSTLPSFKVLSPWWR
jgi:hypothetical protein